MGYTMLMHGAIILYGANKANRRTHALKLLSEDINQLINWENLKNYPDIKLIELLEDKKSIGIAQIKEAINFLNEKPFSLRSKIIIIDDAHTLTDEAQNALLKTLEEPPVYGVIYLLTKTENSLLPTVLSRCRKLQVKTQNGMVAKESKYIDYVTFAGLSAGQRFDWAEETGKEEKADVIELLEDYVLQAREVLLINADQKTASNINHLLKVIADLENTNLGSRIALEVLALEIE